MEKKIELTCFIIIIIIFFTSCLTNKLSVDSINDSNLSNSQDSFLHLSSVKTSLQNFTLADQILEETEETFQSDSRNLELTKMESSSESEAKNETVQETFCWRIDLSKTEPYWKGWFQGLSNLFLNSPAQAKLLLLAGVDRLDKALTIGQMQGTFLKSNFPSFFQTNFKHFFKLNYFLLNR